MGYIGCGAPGDGYGIIGGVGYEELMGLIIGELCGLGFCKGIQTGLYNGVCPFTCILLDMGFG